VKDDVIQILNSRRIMAISTVRPDGWPQTTIVGYANAGLAIYFVISRASQKYANIAQDNRVSIAVGEEPRDLSQLKAVFAGAKAAEVVDLAEADQAWRLLKVRHPNLAWLELPDQSETALMRALCIHVSMLDYSQGLGHTEAIDLGP
jgi:nitroimidazol reductase NimA-like FMN-containing flavoprotein (pyridoxamine 5'-phosphate oxidase superfamily)